MRGENTVPTHNKPVRCSSVDQRPGHRERCVRGLTAGLCRKRYQTYAACRSSSAWSWPRMTPLPAALAQAACVHRSRRDHQASLRRRCQGTDDGGQSLADGRDRYRMRARNLWGSDYIGAATGSREVSRTALEQLRVAPAPGLACRIWIRIACWRRHAAPPGTGIPIALQCVGSGQESPCGQKY